MSNFFADYREAHTRACLEARKLNREMQLRAGKEYTRKGYYVSIAVGAAHRYGVDAQGEFITPATLLMSPCGR